MKFYELKTEWNILKYKIDKAISALIKKPKSYIIVEHRNSAGELLYHNASALIDLGEEAIIKSFFGNVTNYTPTGFKVNLATDATILETASTYTAVSGTGYAEVAVGRNTDWTPAFVGGDWRVTSKNCVFTAGGTWTTATKMVLSATLNSVDVLIAYADLSTNRTLVNGDVLTTSIIQSLS